MSLICYVFAFVLFCIATFAPWAIVEPARLRLVAAGLAFWVLPSILVGGEAFLHVTH